MRWIFVLGITVGVSSAIAQKSPAQEAPTTPFDFDNYRRSPQAIRESSQPWASKTNSDLQRKRLSQDVRKPDNLASQAAALFPEPTKIPLRREPEPLPTPNEWVDELTVAQHGETTKGQKDLLARGKLSKQLDLSSMTEEDYELYIAQQRAGPANSPAQTGEGLLRPMPTLVNSKTGGPPHVHSVSQAGLGARAEPRSGENQFEEMTRFFRLDQPLTRAADPWPSPSAQASASRPPKNPPQMESFQNASEVPDNQTNPAGSNP